MIIAVSLLSWLSKTPRRTAMQWRAKWLPGDKLMRRGAVFDGEEPGRG
jgi:hypothetical protein